MAFMKNQGFLALLLLGISATGCLPAQKTETVGANRKKVSGFDASRESSEGGETFEMKLKLAVATDFSTEASELQGMLKTYRVSAKPLADESCATLKNVEENVAFGYGGFRLVLDASCHYAVTVELGQGPETGSISDATSPLNVVYYGIKEPLQVNKEALSADGYMKFTLELLPAGISAGFKTSQIVLEKLAGDADVTNEKVITPTPATKGVSTNQGAFDDAGETPSTTTPPASTEQKPTTTTSPPPPPANEDPLNDF